MQVKIVKGNSKNYYTCDHVCVRVNGPETVAVKSGMTEPGIIIEMSPGPTLHLPEDGDSIYFINDAGKTVDAYHWPPRDKSASADRGDAEVHTNG